MKQKIFWCKTNSYFAQQWHELGEAAWKTGYLIATCVVTDQAKRRWVKFVLKTLTALKTGEKLYITGCWVLKNGEIDKHFFSQYPEFEAHKEVIELLPEDPRDALMNPFSPEVQHQNLQTKLAKIKWALGTQTWLTRKTVVIQTGCDNFCTFCLTVQARGRHQYRSIEAILSEIQGFIETWGKEVVLTWINLWAWWADTSLAYKNARLTELLDAILTKTSIERLRISSLWVEFLTDAVIEYFTHPRIIAYAHLSIQSGSDTILNKMHRNYTRTELLDRLEKIHNLKRNDGVTVQIWADLIVGFPWETEQDFADTLSLVTDYHVSQLHAFPFSWHYETYPVPAGLFPNQIPDHIKFSRQRKLLEAWEFSKQQFILQHIWKPLLLLLEGQPTALQFSWWSQNYIELNAINFIPNPASVYKKGIVISGVLKMNARDAY